MKTLYRDIKNVSFFRREVRNGKVVSNKCGRDFLYYALHFYYPDQFNNSRNTPKDIDASRLFGIPVPAAFAWTQIQFARVAKFLKKHHLELSVNGKKVRGYASFVGAIVFSRKRYEEAMAEIEAAVNKNEVMGVDISLGIFGLLGPRTVRPWL